VKRARFIAPAREEFLAEVAYYNEVQQGTRFVAAVEEATPAHSRFPLPAHRRSRIPAESWSRIFRSRSFIDRSPTASSCSPWHIIRGSPVTGVAEFTEVSAA